MAKQNKAKKIIGKEAFEAYYSDLYGSRWPLLKESFSKEGVYATIDCGGSEKYYLDPASVMASMQLPLDNAKNILDMCAAPGGKTLILSNRMEEDAILVSNERSASRKLRLAQVVSTVLPESISSRIKISCSDASTWCLQQTEAYDAILLDAPCSSERHVYNDEKYLNEWTPSRVKTLSITQWALLSCAYRLLKKGGFLLYSTCALAKAENDDVLDKLFKKFDDVHDFFLENNIEPSIDVERLGRFCSLPVVPSFERTKRGYHILPDREGMGPIYFSLIQKQVD